MKTRYILCALGLAVSLSACDSYLDTTNESVVPAHDELTSLDALRSTTANLYASPWYAFHKQRFFQLGDARANNLYISASASNDNNAQASFSEKNENASVTQAWGSLYNVITQAAYIIDDYAPYCVEQGACSQREANECVAEARFMRAMAYYFLAIYWHDVPIIDNAVTSSSVAAPNRFEDVLQYAITEAEYAQRWLPAAPYQTGRVSRVSARALLSRLYLTAAAFARGGHFTDDFRQVLNEYYADDYDWQASGGTLTEFYYAKAAEAARQAINEGTAAGYGLMDDYEQLFRVQNNNCREVLFALQFVGGSVVTGLANDLQGYLCYDTCLDNNYGRAWSTWASYDFCLVAARRGGLSRTRGNVFANGMTYDYLYHEYDTCSVQGTTWTVTGRSTLPVKKHVVGGPMATGNVAFNGNSGFCTPMLRLSEVYLNLTEALMGLYGQDETTDATILEGVNTVRRRAFKTERANGRYPGDYGTTGAFNLDSLMQERRMEFFMEGLSWGDIVRRSFMGDSHLQRMLDYNNNRLLEQEGDSIMGCHRLCRYKYTAAQDDQHLGTVTLTQANGGYQVARPVRECVHKVPADSYCHSNALGCEDNLWSMVYPPTETVQDPNLLNAPVAYDFTRIIQNKIDYHE